MRVAALLLSVLGLVLAAVLFLRPSGDEPRGRALSPGTSAGTHASSSEGDPRGVDPTNSFGAARQTASGGRSGALEFVGRAEHWMSREALAGAAFEFRFEDRAVEVASDAEGRFAVALEPSRMSEVEIVPPEGYWTLAHGFDERSPVPTYLARFAPSHLGPFRARLIDERTSEPLPEYVVRVRGTGDWSETVRTDDKGILRTQVLFEAGTLSFLASEEEFGEERGGWTLARTEFSPAGPRPPLATIAIETGPSYTLIIDKPAELGLEKLRAYLVDSAWLEDLDREADAGQLLHVGPTTWVRFGEDPSWIEDPRLVLLGPAGRWRGVATVDAGPGRHPDPVHVRVEALAQLLGVVVDASGESVPRAELELNSSDDEGVSRWLRSNGRGNFAFQGLPAGPYTLNIRHGTKGSLTAMVDVAVSASERKTYELDPIAVGGDLEGVVRSTSGEFRGPATLLLEPVAVEGGQDLPRRTQRLRWTREGAEHVARFRFQGVADARHTLRLLLQRDPYATSPETLELSPPNHTVELVVRDEREVFFLTFLPMDATSGTWLTGVHLRLTGAGGEELYSGPASGWSSPRAFAEDEVLSWELRKEGYVTARGDRSAFEGSWSARRRYAAIRLRRN